MLNFGLIGFLAVGLGICGAAFWNAAPLAWLLAGLLTTGAGVLALLYNRSRLGWLILIGLVCCGGLFYSARRHAYQLQREINAAYSGRTVAVTGAVTERPEETAWGGISFILTARSGGKGPSGKIQIYCREKIASATWYGRRLRVAGKFKVAPAGTGRFPEFAERRNLAGTIYLNALPALKPGFGLPFVYIYADQLRLRMTAVGERQLEPLNRRFLHGMLFGEDLKEDGGAAGRLRDGLRKTGTIHLLTVSGLHIGFIVAGLFLLLKLLRVPSKWRFIPLTLLVGFYIMMTGMEPPVLRAGLMLFFLMAAKAVGADAAGPNRLGLSGILLLLFNPYNLFEVGFQLSFLATLGVVWLYPQFKEYFPAKTKLGGLLQDGLTVSLAAQLMIIPVIVYYFQQIAWLAPVVNLILLAPAGLIVGGGLVGELLGIVFPWPGRLILEAVELLIVFTRWIIQFFNNQPWIACWTPSWPWPWMTAYYLGLFLSLDHWRPNLLTQKTRLTKGAALLLLLAGANLVVWLGLAERLNHNYLEVAFIDVGQGDAIFLKTPEGRTALIDGGPDGRGRQKVAPLLKKCGVTRLDLVFGTHGHSDHLGGLDEVLDEIPAVAVYLPRRREKSLTARQLQRQLKKLRLPPRTVAAGMRFRLGKKVTLTAYQSDADLPENEASLALAVEFGKNKILLTGDLCLEGEKIIVAQNNPRSLRATVLKVGHHGSDYATAWPFLAQTQPRLTVISVGTGNGFGHPGERTLNRLHSLGVKVFRTDRQGTILLRVYRDKIVAIPAKGGYG